MTTWFDGLKFAEREQQKHEGIRGYPECLEATAQYRLTDPFWQGVMDYVEHYCKLKEIENGKKEEQE